MGANGEEAVGARLEKLISHDWRLLHSVPVGDRGGDIDHVVLGPGGVYTGNTNNHPGKRIWVGRNTIKVGGSSKSSLRSSRFEAERAARLLTSAAGWPVIVKPALVFDTETLIPDVTIRQQPEGVAVLDHTEAPRAFRRAPND